MERAEKYWLLKTSLSINEEVSMPFTHEPTEEDVLEFVDRFGAYYDLVRVEVFWRVIHIV